jgi:hypothetical protein
MESLHVYLPRKLDLLVNLLIHLYIKFHESKHCKINKKIFTQYHDLIIFMSLPILFLRPHKICH